MDIEKLAVAKDNTLKAKAVWIVGFLILIWAVHLINFATGYWLSDWGIYPRSIRGLFGILFSPFLHAGFTHIICNTIPFAILGGLVIVRGVGIFLELTLFVILLGGGAVWLIAGGGNHIGASGLIFGYFGYLLARGWYDRSVISIAVAALTFFLYGGLLLGVLPTLKCISWEGHLFGMIAGVLGAKFNHSKSRG